MSDADKLRQQKPSSTDPERLERMARKAEELEKVESDSPRCRHCGQERGRHESACQVSDVPGKLHEWGAAADRTCPRCFGSGGHAETCRKCLGTGRTAE